MGRRDKTGMDVQDNRNGTINPGSAKYLLAAAAGIEPATSEAIMDCHRAVIESTPAYGMELSRRDIYYLCNQIVNLFFPSIACTRL